MNEDKLLEINELCVSYGDDRVLDAVSFDMRRGEIAAIVGESGSGKTTLLRSIMSILDSDGKITGGTVRFLGRDMMSLSKKERIKTTGKDISMIFQNSEMSMDPVKTVGSQITECITVHQKIDKKTAAEQGKALLSEFHFDDVSRVWNSYPFELSGGMCQRAATAMAIANSPRLLLADEPTSALDVTVQAQAVKNLVSLRDRTNMSVLLVTHDMGVVAKMADFVGVLYNGKLVEWGKKDEVLYAPVHSYTRFLLSFVKKVENSESEQNSHVLKIAARNAEDKKKYYSETHWALEEQE